MAKVLFKTFQEYENYVLATPSHPAHAMTVRNKRLKEARENDPRLTTRDNPRQQPLMRA